MFFPAQNPKSYLLITCDPSLPSLPLPPPSPHLPPLMTPN